MPPRRVFITVADVSGDQHAAEMIRALRSLDPEVIVEGIGGPRMAEAGAEVVYESLGGAAMGLRRAAARRRARAPARAEVSGGAAGDRDRAGITARGSEIEPCAARRGRPADSREVRQCDVPDPDNQRSA